MTPNRTVPEAPEKVAVIAVLPPATAIAAPAASMVATFLSELAHVAWEEISFDVPSEYFAIALNCCVAPMAAGSGLAGSMVIEDKVAGPEAVEVVEDVELQPTRETTMVAITNRARQATIRRV
jgi:hypothetical protein